MIKYLDLQRITRMHQTEIEQAVHKVVDSGWYLQGEQLQRFERNYAAFIGTKFCVGCGNGLDALTLIFKAYMEQGRLAPGDEVLVPANTYIASILSITANGLVPVLVEPLPNTLQMDVEDAAKKCSTKTRALLLVHLYGRCAYTEKLAALCMQHDLLLVEDNAQAHGCCYGTQRTGSLGHAAAHSFYPGKNLGALGDAGAVTTNDEELARIIKSLGNYGSVEKYNFAYEGRNSRMDDIQAAVLNVKLKYLDADNQRRKEIASTYLLHMENTHVRLVRADADCVYHIFPVFTEQRKALQQHLYNCGIETAIHYPIPPHKQHCYKQWADAYLPVTEKIHREEVSIPLHQALNNDEIEQVIRSINAFEGR